MSVADLAAGAAAFAVMLAGCGAWGAVAARGPADRGERALAWLLAAAAAVIAVHAVPLALGVLSVATVVVASAVAAGAAVVAGRRMRPAAGPSTPDRGDRGPLAGSACLAVAVAAAATVLAGLGTPPLGSDVLNFYGPQVARWIQTGSLWQLDQFVPLVSNATYPQHGDLLLLAAVLPWSSFALAPLVPVPFYAATGVAVAALARRAGAAPGPAALVAAAVLAVPVIALPGLRVLQTDAPMLFFLTAGTLFALRGRPGLAVLGLGLAFGTKWYGVTTVPVVGIALLVVCRPGARRAVLAALGVLAVGGLWLVRNWAETGNPLFPADPPGPLDAPRDVVRELGGFTLLDYATAPGVWRAYLVPAFGTALGWAGAALGALAVAAAGLAAWRRDRARIVLAATGLALALVYAATPYSAFGPEGRPVLAWVSVRYGIPALIAGAVLAAWALRGRGLFAVRAALLVATVVTIPRWAGGVGVAAWLGGALLVLAWLVLRRLPLRVLAAGAVVPALAAVWVLARPAPSYAPYDPVLAWVEDELPPGSAVGLAGVWQGTAPPLPAFGPRLRNRVEYVGPFVAGLLREHPTEAAFRAALRRGGYDAVIVGRGRPPAGAARHERWARAAGYELRAASPTLAVLSR